MPVLRSQRIEPLVIKASTVSSKAVAAYSWASEDGSTSTSNGKDHSGNGRDWTIVGAPSIATGPIGKGRDTSLGRTIAKANYYTLPSLSSLGLGAVGTGAFSMWKRIRMPSVAPSGTFLHYLGRLTNGNSQNPFSFAVYEVSGTGYCWHSWFDDGSQAKLNWNDSGNPAHTAGTDSMLHVTRSSTGTVKFFVNGVKIKTVTGNTTNFAATSNQVTASGLFDTTGGTPPDFLLMDEMYFTTELSEAEVTAHAANPYADYNNTAVADSITVNSPVNSASVGTNIPINVSWAGADTPDYFEASFNGGAYTNIGGTIASGQATVGTLSGQTPGTGSLIVRWHNFPSVSQTITGVTVSADAIAFTSPDKTACVMSTRTFQRNSSNQATVRVTGTYTLSAASKLQWSFAGGTWADLTATLSAGTGTFDTTVTLQGPAAGTFQVRSAVNNSIIATLSDVQVGDVIIMVGQSNNVGKASFYLPPTAPTGHSDWNGLEYDKSNTWRKNVETSGTPMSQEFSSPYPVYLVNGTPMGSYAGELQRLYMAQGIPLAIVPCAVGSTSMSAWAVSTSTTTLYGAALDRANQMGSTGHKGVCIWLGENDSQGTTTQAVFQAGLNAMISDWSTRFPNTKWILLNINNIVDGGGTYTNATAIRAAIQAVGQGGGANVGGYADMQGAWTSPNTHFGQGSAAEITTVATRAFAPMKTAFIDGSLGALNVVLTGGAIGGKSGSASAPFTVTADGIVNGTIVVTPTDNGKGGSFTPSTVSLTNAARSATYTYTPPSGVQQNITLGVTNNASLGNPANQNYTALNITDSGTLRIFRGMMF